MTEVEKLLRPTALILGYVLIFVNNLILAGTFPADFANPLWIILGNYGAAYLLIGSDAYNNKKATELLRNVIAIADSRGIDTAVAKATLGDIQKVTTVIESTPPATGVTIPATPAVVTAPSTDTINIGSPAGGASG